MNSSIPKPHFWFLFLKFKLIYHKFFTKIIKKSLKLFIIYKVLFGMSFFCFYCFVKPSDYSEKRQQTNPIHCYESDVSFNRLLRGEVDNDISCAVYFP